MPRTAVLQIRFTAEERELMAKRAEAEHRSLSDWARLVLLNAGSDGAYVESQPVVRTDPSRSAVRRAASPIPAGRREVRTFPKGGKP